MAENLKYSVEEILLPSAKWQKICNKYGREIVTVGQVTENLKYIVKEELLL